LDAAALKDLPLFAGLSDHDLELIAPHADSASVPAGTVFMREGDRGQGLVILVSGTARVSHGGEVIDDLGPGAVIGEIGVMEDQPRRATVQAVTDLELVVIFDPEFRQIVEIVPEVRAKVAAIIAERLGASTDDPD